MAKSNFSAFSKKLKNAEDALGKGRKGRKGFVEVEPGRYTVRCQSLEFGVNGKIPFTHLNTIVVGSDNEEDLGLRVAERISFEEKSGVKNGKSWKMTEEDFFAQLCTSIQAFGVDTSELEMDDLEALADSLAEDQPATSITVAEKNGYSRIKWGKFIEDDDLPSLEDVLDDDDEDEEEEDEEDNEEEDDNDGEDEEEGEEEEDEPIEKDDLVMAKPPKTKVLAEYKVKSSNKGKKTCTLIRTKDSREYKDCPWECVESFV